MNYRRLLVVAGICFLIGTVLQQEVQTFHSRNSRRRGRRQLKRNRVFDPVGKYQQRGEKWKVRSESVRKILRQSVNKLNI